MQKIYTHAEVWFQYSFFYICVFFNERSRFTGQQEEGKGISLTPIYYLLPLRRRLDISRRLLLGAYLCT